MTMMNLDLRPAPQEPKATIHQTNNAKIASPERQAQKGQPNVNRATKESLETHLAVLATTVYQKRFKTKVLVHHALCAPLDGYNPTKVHPPAPVSIGKPWKVAKTVNI